MKNKVLGALLAGTIVVSAFASTAITAGATPVGHGPYKPSEGVETNKYYFAMPGGWVNDSTHENNDVAGIYWWTATDSPDDKFGHGWPGYEMDKEAEKDNLWSINAPKDVSIVVFSNYLDGGMDSTLPIFKDALQCQNKNVEYYNEGDADTYSQKFWEYMWTKAAKQMGFDTDDPNFDYTSDEVYEAMINPANADKIDFSDEFGEYGKNFYAELENESGLAMNFQNMVYVVDLDPAHIKTVNEDLIPGGKPAYDGEFYFYYGNGEYGMWPTKAMALKMEGVTDNGDGTYTGGAKVDDYGTVFNEDGQVVIGNFTGKYWESKEAPTAPVTEATDLKVTTVVNKTQTLASNTFKVGDVVEDKITYKLTGMGNVLSGKWTYAYDPALLKYTSASMPEFPDAKITGPVADENGKMVITGTFETEAGVDFTTQKILVDVKFEAIKAGEATNNFDMVDLKAQKGDVYKDGKKLIETDDIPDPDNNGASSSTSDSTSDSGTTGSNGGNDAVQTGATSFAVVILAAAVGAVVVMYFRRRKIEE